MRSHVTKPFLREIEREFNRAYPYLKIEFPKNGGEPRSSGLDDPAAERQNTRHDDPAAERQHTRHDDPEGEALRDSARALLRADAGMTDGMTVKELEAALFALLASSVQIFRRSGSIWLETKMTRDWTLRQQNDRGRELTQ